MKTIQEIYVQRVRFARHLADAGDLEGALRLIDKEDLVRRVELHALAEKQQRLNVN